MKLPNKWTSLEGCLELCVTLHCVLQGCTTIILHGRCYLPLRFWAIFSILKLKQRHLLKHSVQNLVDLWFFALKRKHKFQTGFLIAVSSRRLNCFSAFWAMCICGQTISQVSLRNWSGGFLFAPPPTQLGFPHRNPKSWSRNSFSCNFKIPICRTFRAYQNIEGVVAWFPIWREWAVTEQPGWVACVPLVGATGMPPQFPFGLIQQSKFLILPNWRQMLECCFTC